MKEADWVFTNRLVVVNLSGADLTLANPLFYGLTLAGLGAALGLGLGFLGLAYFLMAVTGSCLSVTATV
jgi:hypothetical protein